MRSKSFCPSEVDSGNGRLGLRGPTGATVRLAFGATRCDPALKAFRKRLEDAGKSFKRAITAAARKRLTILNAMARTGPDTRKQAA